MKLKLVAFAVAAAAASAVSAQTANVTLYGVLDTYVESARVSGGAATAVRGSTLRMSAGGLSGSRWGLRGSESLGGGMNAIFTLEGGFGSDTGALGQSNFNAANGPVIGRLFGRRAFVGLSGGFGQVTLGRDYAPNFWVQCNSDDSFGGCLTSWSFVGNAMTGFANSLRQDNQLSYKTPNMGGLTSQVAWAFGESSVGTSAGRTFGMNVEYKAGPLYLGAGYSDQKNPAGTASNKQTLIGATYNAGVVYVGGTYAQHKTDTGGKVKALAASGTVPMGASRLGLQFGQAKSGSAKARSLAFIAENDLSKRTTVYGAVAQIKNDGLAVGTGGATPAGLGQTGRSLAVGLRHRF
ncbi:MAG: porin [Betaproteobacteria bacterium]|nr:MAG: porin [Betaproteobacteria bacterium]TAG48538.1 MAG: porin [Betaproteobacteria bacterium]TAG76994.1 MAG: porin [Betaproteobacteria bacterium]